MGAPFTYPVSGRRINPDGTIDIKCRICEKTICREPYRGFSTAFCAVCQGDIDAGMRPEEILAKVKLVEQEQSNELYNDLGMGGFKVLSPWKRVKEVIQEIRKAASGRKRSALFSRKDIKK